MTSEELSHFLHASSWQSSRLGLERMETLMTLLGHPERQLRFIHVAGTNGKGSIAAMLSSILTQAGYTTGMYTSPHLLQVNERMKINGIDISNEELLTLAESVRLAVEEMSDPPTEFERITAMALLYFQRRACQVVVLEVGLGGRLDATNVIPAPDAAVIANIALEHTAVLGNTLEQIAREKAGIIKKGSSVVLYRQGPSVEAVVRDVCQQQGASLFVTDPARGRTVSALEEVLNQPELALDKVNLPYIPEALRAEVEALLKNAPVSFAWSSPHSVEITHSQATKANGMLTACRILGVDPACTMAIGDSGNDIPMLRAAALGVAMGNATREVKDAADAVTASNMEDGAAIAIERYILGCSRPL